MLITDSNVFSPEEPIRKDIETTPGSVNGAGCLHCRDSFACVARCTEILSRRRFSLCIQDETRRCFTDQFLARSSESRAKRRIGQIEDMVQGDFEGKQQFGIARHIRKLAVASVEKGLNLFQRCNSAVCRVEKRERFGSIVATSIFQCADRG